MKNGPHILLSAESGTGKSSTAASIVGSPPAIKSKRPVLVQLFDPSDKGTPYRQRGDGIEREKWDYGERELVVASGNHVATIERWHEKQGRGSAGITMKGGEKVKTSKYILQGKVYESYLERMKYFADEVDEGTWYAYIHDSSTFFELAIRSYLSGVMQVNDNKMIWGQATDEIEHFYMALFSDLPITTILIAHALPERVTTTDDRGRRVRMRGEADDVPYEARMPGRIAKDILATFGEVYRPYVTYERNEETRKKGPVYWVQTRSDGIWRCSSQLHVPDPLGPWREGDACDAWKHIWQATRR